MQIEGNGDVKGRMTSRVKEESEDSQELRQSETHSQKSTKLGRQAKSSSTFSKNFANTISSKKNNSTHNQTNLDSFVNKSPLSESGNSEFE